MEAFDPTIEEEAKQKIRSIAQKFSGDFVNRVAVLGAFDTWPYMDYISRLIASNNYVAVTSKYLYRKVNGKVLRMRTQEHQGFAPQFHFMGALLDQIISDCSSAIISFSVSAAHFIEIDWCYKKSKKTLGVAYVRAASGLEKGSCENLTTADTNQGAYSFCNIDSKNTRTAWDCMKENVYCPFISQDISKNVIEYFFRGKDMEIVAVENISILPSVINTKYPISDEYPVETKELDTEIIKDDEVVFTKDCICFILSLEKLSKSSFIHRLSPMKTLTILQKTQGWSDAMSSNPSKLRYFLSKNFKKQEPFVSLKKGFVDIDRIGSNFEKIALFLEKKGYIEMKRVKGTENLQVSLVRLKTKGKKLSKFYKAN